MIESYFSAVLKIFPPSFWILEVTVLETTALMSTKTLPLASLSNGIGSVGVPLA